MLIRDKKGLLPETLRTSWDLGNEDGRAHLTVRTNIWANTNLEHTLPDLGLTKINLEGKSLAALRYNDKHHKGQTGLCLPFDFRALMIKGFPSSSRHHLFFFGGGIRNDLDPTRSFPKIMCLELLQIRMHPGNPISRSQSDPHTYKLNLPMETF